MRRRIEGRLRKEARGLWERDGVDEVAETEGRGTAGAMERNLEVEGRS